MNQTAALTHLAVPVVLHRWRVLDAWTTARYRSTQILRGGGQWGRTDRVLKVRKGWRKGANHPPGQKQYTTVHVDKVAEGVNIGASHTFPSTVVQGDASGQRQRHQQISDSEVYGVDHRGWGVGGGPTEDIESQAVEDHTDHQHKTVTHLQQGQIGHQWSFRSRWVTGLLKSFRLFLVEMTVYHERDPYCVKVLVKLHIQVGDPVQVWWTPALVPGATVDWVRGQEGLSGRADVGEKALHWWVNNDRLGFWSGELQRLQKKSKIHVPTDVFPMVFVYLFFPV